MVIFIYLFSFFLVASAFLDCIEKRRVGYLFVLFFQSRIKTGEPRGLGYYMDEACFIHDFASSSRID